jgi:hypothetical protein
MVSTHIGSRVPRRAPEGVTLVSIHAGSDVPLGGFHAHPGRLPAERAHCPRRARMCTEPLPRARGASTPRARVTGAAGLDFGTSNGGSRLATLRVCDASFEGRTTTFPRSPRPAKLCGLRLIPWTSGHSNAFLRALPPRRALSHSAEGTLS